MRRIQDALCRAHQDVRVWRNNVGTAWTAKKIRHNMDGSITLFGAYKIRFGLCNGSADLIGPTPYVIKPEDVGKSVAIFTAIEVKTARGKAALTQKRFMSMVRGVGGRARIVRSTSEALELLTEAPRSALNDDEVSGESDGTADTLVASGDEISQRECDADSDEN